MTFRQIEIFVAVCSYQSINQTAQVLFTSQQGISRMIRELEQELGCTLLIRTATGVTTTREGQYFLGEARAMLEHKKAVISNLQKGKDLPQEVILLGMAYGMIGALPHDLLPKFSAQNPQVLIDYSDHPDIRLENLLMKDEYDICVTTGVINSDLFVSKLLAQEEVRLCIPRGHPLYGSENLSMEDLAPHTFALWSSQFSLHHRFKDACIRAGFDPHIEVSSSDFNTLREIAFNRGLLFIVPVHSLHQTVYPVGDTVFSHCPFPDASLHWQIRLTYKKNKHLTPNMSALCHHIEQAFL